MMLVPGFFSMVGISTIRPRSFSGATSPVRYTGRGMGTASLSGCPPQAPRVQQGGVAPPERLALQATEGRLLQARGSVRHRQQCLRPGTTRPVSLAVEDPRDSPQVDEAAPAAARGEPPVARERQAARAGQAAEAVDFL